MSVDELWRLHEEISSVLATRLSEEKTRLEMRLRQLEGVNGSFPRARRPYPQVFPKYRNPAQPAETWSGRGKQPRWLAAQLSSGKKLDDFRIRPLSTPARRASGGRKPGRGQRRAWGTELLPTNGSGLCAVPGHTVAASSYLNRYGRPTHPTHLANHKCFGYTRLPPAGAWRYTNAAGEQVSARPVGQLRINNGEALLPAVIAGLGIADLPDFIIDDAIRAGRIEVLLDASGRRAASGQAAGWPRAGARGGVGGFPDPAFFGAKAAEVARCVICCRSDGSPGQPFDVTNQAENWSF
jgi:H-NS histone family/LysR substrate binding domain